MTHNTSPAPEASNEDVPVPFEGDFFGASAEYAGEDLPFDDDGVAADMATCQPAHNPESDEDSDAEDEAVGEDLTEPRLRTSVGGGELPRHSPAIPRDPSPMDVDDNRGSESPTPDVHGLSSALSAAPGGIDIDAHIQLRQSPAYVIPFGGQAGMPCTPPLAGQPTRSGYEAYAHQVDPKDMNLYAPFTSRLDWEIAQWAKLRGPGSTVFSDLLTIEEVCERLGLSFKNTNELNKIIDNKLPNHCPVFRQFEACVGGEQFAMFCRNIMECITVLYGDTEHARYICVTPVCHCADTDCTICLYHDLHTGQWWWATQEIRRKPSHRGQILLTYLPTSRLEHIKNKAACHRTLANLFHACMSMATEPLRVIGIDGVPMASGDGIVLVMGTYTRDCPICKCPHGELGTYPCPYDYRDLDEALDALAFAGTGEYNHACGDAGIKPIQHPFLEKLLYLHQGVIKHLLAWLTDIVGKHEIDVRVKCLPLNHSIHIFQKGISGLTCVTGTEHKQIAWFILGLVIDVRLPHGESTEDLVSATKSLLDFLHIAQYSVHSSTTLDTLERTLSDFHARKSIFISLGARSNFIIPKLHMLVHYIRTIKLYGTTDNYNTEWPTHKAVPLMELVAPSGYGATFLMAALAHFVVELNTPTLTKNKIERCTANLTFPLQALPVYHKIKFRNTEYHGNETLDSIHTQPQCVTSNGNVLAHARFDTALVHVRHNADMPVGQVRAVFSLPEKLLLLLFPTVAQIPRHLVYIEWFTPFMAEPDSRYGVYKVGRLTGSAKIASVVPLTLLERSVHLFPKWGGPVPTAWKSENILDECRTFYLNPTKDTHSYYNLY
ncbi:hypothetical protein C8Q72DRAFT_878767 [Fomitopsis betulina]|nr:hypothetical protein C8Q72DRAFT_878767 [Fomitopsis betulina]